MERAVGEYRIEKVLAMRGSNHEYEAVHCVLPRRVALKIPAAQVTPRSFAVDLLREACIVEALDHPGIPRLYECGLLDDRRPWIAMELVEGTNLAARTGDLSVAWIAAILRDVADILRHTHARGIVHHNVIAEAIVFPSEPRHFPLRLVDWRSAHPADSGAPDIYALGLIARELLRSLDTPPVLEALVTQMLADVPKARPGAAVVHGVASCVISAADNTRL